MTTLEIDVHGLPAPQGSKRAFRNPHSGRVQLVESSSRVKTWREDVKQAALDAIDSSAPNGAYLSGPIRLDVDFFVPRPKSHFRTGANAHLLRDKAPNRPVGKPDLDKLLRSTCDALTAAGVWSDDSCVVAIAAAKFYAARDHSIGARITITPYEGPAS